MKVFGIVPREEPWAAVEERSWVCEIPRSAWGGVEWAQISLVL